MSKIKILSQLIQYRDKHTSFLAMQNIKIKHERFEVEYDNSQCEIVEYQIYKSELFHDSYPYKEFKRYQLPNLEKK